MPSTVTSSSAAFGGWAFGIGQPRRGRRGRTDIVKGRSVRSGGNVLTTLSCSASGIFAICCDLTRLTITRLARTFQSTRTRRRREQYMPLVAFCLRHFLADFIICMCEFDFRQAQLGLGDTPQESRNARGALERKSTGSANWKSSHHQSFQRLSVGTSVAVGPLWTAQTVGPNMDEQCHR